MGVNASLIEPMSAGGEWPHNAYQDPRFDVFMPSFLEPTP
jgi:hypothetical protein